MSSEESPLTPSVPSSLPPSSPAQAVSNSTHTSFTRLQYYTQNCSTQVEPLPEDNPPASDAPDAGGSSPSTLSKRQLKKLEKKRKWEEMKVLRRDKRKVKKKQYTEKVRQGLIPNFQSRKALKANTVERAGSNIAVAIDMSFNERMIEKDMAKCIKQIHRCYSINRRQPTPLQFFVSSFGGVAEDAIAKHLGWEHWDVKFTSQHFTELEGYEEKDRIVYLTSESENVLSELQPNHLYVIGGLVDHNQFKGLCHSRAKRSEVGHARLPLDDFNELQTRKVLTVDHVFEILVHVSNGIAWEEAFRTVIAPRKLAGGLQCSEVS